MRVVILDVGQGDATLVRLPDERVLLRRPRNAEAAAPTTQWPAEQGPRVDADVAPGEATTVTFRPLRLGYFTYYSDVPADRALGMRGTMTIFI